MMSELLERVKAATGPSRLLDADIYESLGYDVKRHAKRVSGSYKHHTTRSFAYLDGSRWIAMERLSASVDASLALANRLLNDMPDSPEYPLEVTLSSVGLEGPWRAAIWSGAENDGQKHYAKTLPLAILAALLTALSTPKES